MRITYETRPMLFSKNPIEPVPPKQTRYVGVLQHFLPSSKEGRMIPTNSEPFTYLEVSHFNMEALKCIVQAIDPKDLELSQI